MVKKTENPVITSKGLIRLISAASKYLDRLGAKRVAFHGSRNSFMVVGQVELSPLFLERKEKSTDR